MMYRLFLVHSFAVILFSTGCQAPNSRDNSNGVSPQALPVRTWLVAAKNRDTELLKTVFSERMRAKFDRGGWEEPLDSYHKVFKSDFGDYQPADFTFEFRGTGQEGKVLLVHKGKMVGGGLRVIKEGRDWKVDEN